MRVIIPVIWPKLPAAASLAPSLGAIDTARLYGNFEPLKQSPDVRLATSFNLATAISTPAAIAALRVRVASSAAC